MRTPARDWDPGPALRRHLEAFSAERSPFGTPQALRRAETYAGEIFRSAGMRTSVEAIAATDGLWHNIFGEAGPPEAPLFIIGAHLDTVQGSPGADDNASSVAALLALAEWFGGQPVPSSAEEQTALTLRLVAFNLEEWGMMGSREHARILAGQRRQVEGMVSLEMIGYADDHPGSQRYPPGFGIGRPSTGNFISVVGNRSSRDLVRRVTRAFREVDGLPVESIALPDLVAALIGASLSDHFPFWRRGYRALMVGDTAFYRNPHYHRSSDTLATLSLPFLEKVTRGLAVLVESLGGRLGGETGAAG
jgi:Zn-dependent M28 family amino/carboxypeptidase